MKFSQIEVGQRFQYQDKLFVKTGPVAATELGTGKARVIPRYAVLIPADLSKRQAHPGDQVAKLISSDAVVDMFDRFYAECLEILADHPDPTVYERLGAAKARFLAAL
jgi:hypothetical protein